MKTLGVNTLNLSNNSAIAVLLVSVTGMGTVIGMTFPLVSLTLERLDYSATLIGINSAIGSLGILAVGLLTARVVRNFGMLGPIVLAALLAAGSLFAMPALDHAIGWFGLRFTLAVGLGFLWLISEAWLNALATPENRGRVIGLYSTAFSAGFALGPILIAVIGSQGVIPFVVAAAILVTAFLPMLLLARKSILKEDEGGARFSLFYIAPVVFWVALAAGAFETTSFALLPMYTLAEGINEAGSMYALSAFSAGGIALQFPLGRLADQHGRRALLVITAIGVLLGAVALPFAVSSSTALLVILFFWGGLIFGLYTLGLVLLGDKFRTTSMVAANALFIVFYEAGAFGGPALTGMAMDLWPQQGYPGGMIFASCLLGILTFMYLRKSQLK